MSFTYIFSLHLTHIYSHWPPILLPLPPIPTHPSYFPSSHPIIVILLSWVSIHCCGSNVIHLHLLSSPDTHLLPLTPHPTPPIPLSYSPIQLTQFPPILVILLSWMSIHYCGSNVIHLHLLSSPDTHLLPLTPHPTPPIPPSYSPILLPQFPPIIVILLSWVSIHYCGSNVIHLHLLSSPDTHLLPLTPILLPLPPHPTHHPTSPVPTYHRYPS